MNAVLGYLAFGGFVLSLATHILSLIGIDVESHVPSVWVLHVGIFVAFIPMAYQLKSSIEKPDPFAIFRGLPSWAGAATVWLMVYVFLNFLLVFGGANDGSPTILNGVFVLKQKGQVIREITEVEYHARCATILRGFSGHWLLFYFLPFSHFILRKRAIANEKVADT